MANSKTVPKVIGLFSGCGGLDYGFQQQGFKIVYANDIEKNVKATYEYNLKHEIDINDLRNVEKAKIPQGDVILAGIPCQPFSRAGKMLGFDDLKKGNHFFRILSIIDIQKEKAPKYLLLENVETVLKHNKGETFKVIESELLKRGYEIKKKIMSPHEFNIPHHRRRLFIVGARKDMGGLDNFDFPEKLDISKTKIDSILCPEHKPYPEENLYLNKPNREVFDIWNNFIETFPDDSALPGFPIWSHEWGATYPYKNYSPQVATIEELTSSRGIYGERIIGANKDNMLKDFIPRYAQKDQEKFPDWKISYIRKNRDFYKKNKEFIDDFVLRNPRLKKLEFSYQKLEWSCQGAARTFNDKILQFRPSGLRVKLNNWAPALTTIRTQNVYIPKLKRRLSLLELSKLQSMDIKHLPDIYDGKFVPNGGYKAFGNAVNVKVVGLIAKNLLNN